MSIVSLSQVQMHVSFVPVNHPILYWIWYCAV